MLASLAADMISTTNAIRDSQAYMQIHGAGGECSPGRRTRDIGGMQRSWCVLEP